MTLGHRLMVMNAGIAEQIGTPQEVYHRPATRFVAGFIGSPGMNFLPGRIAADGGAVDLPGGQSIVTPASCVASPGRPVAVGIRPEHLGLNGPAAPGPRIMVRSEMIERLGADAIVHGRIEGEESATLLARLPGDTSARSGDLLALSVADGAIHLFDAETGKVLAEPTQHSPLFNCSQE